MPEVIKTEDPVVVKEERKSDHGMLVAKRIVNLIGVIILGLLAIRFIFILLGANRANGFADFIYSVTGPLVSPFFGLFNYTPEFGTARFEYETLVAMLFYAIVVAVIARLVTVGRHKTV